MKVDGILRNFGGNLGYLVNYGQSWGSMGNLVKDRNSIWPWTDRQIDIRTCRAVPLQLKMKIMRETVRVQSEKCDIMTQICTIFWKSHLEELWGQNIKIMLHFSGIRSYLISFITDILYCVICPMIIIVHNSPWTSPALVAPLPRVMTRLDGMTSDYEMTKSVRVKSSNS